MIATSVNINTGLAEMLVLSVQQNGITKQALVHRLFWKVLKEARLSKPIVFRRVAYQKPDPDKQWKNEPITLSPDMYEMCHDMRRVLKLSVSFLLAYAIRTYLKQVIHELTVNKTGHAEMTYNSLPQYSINSIFTTSAEGFIIQWVDAQKKNE